MTMNSGAPELLAAPDLGIVQRPFHAHAYGLRAKLGGHGRAGHRFLQVTDHFGVGLCPSHAIDNAVASVGAAAGGVLIICIRAGDLIKLLDDAAIVVAPAFGKRVAIQKLLVLHSLELVFTSGIVNGAHQVFADVLLPAVIAGDVVFPGQEKLAHLVAYPGRAFIDGADSAGIGHHFEAVTVHPGHVARIGIFGRVVRYIGGEALLACLPNMHKHLLGGHKGGDLLEILSAAPAAVTNDIDLVGPSNAVALLQIRGKLGMIPVAIGTRGTEPVAAGKVVQLQNRRLHLSLILVWHQINGLQGKGAGLFISGKEGEKRAHAPVFLPQCQ